MSNSEPVNSERELVRLLRSIGEELGIEVTTAFTDWIVELKSPENCVARVFGYDFGLNPSSAAEIARDKCATSHVLAKANIRCVEHHIVFRPDFGKFSGQTSTYQTAYQLFRRFGDDVVCKNNRGTGGTHVYRATTAQQVEQAMARVFAVHYACALSPFRNITAEYRVILVDGEATAVFSKARPAVVGDGVSTVAVLIAKTHPDALGAERPIELSREELCAVPNRGKSLEINWRHNLGKGAMPNFEMSTELRDDLVAMARCALVALCMRCGSVDIVLVGGQLEVLEVNNGIMVEGLSRSGEVGHKLARSTYERLVRCVLNLPA